MPITQARALFGNDDVRIEPHRPEREHIALRALAVWAHRLSPSVAVDGTDGLLLDVTGCAGVFRGEGRMSSIATESFRKIGFHTRLAIAPTFGCAWAAARFADAENQTIHGDKIRDALEPLPIEALRVDAGTAADLRELGISAVGHLLDMPRSTLPARFGDRLLLRLDQALGQAIETIEHVRPTTPPAVARVFDGPTDRIEAIVLTLRALLDELCEQLLSRECGARTLQVELDRSDLPPERLVITLARPSRDPRHLWSLLRVKLEAAHLGFGVEAVRLRADQIARIPHRQTSRFESEATIGEVEIECVIAELTDTLRNRLGPDRVHRVSVTESHVPERAFGFQHRAERVGSITPNDRPTALFDPPIPARVVALTPDGPVHRVRWHDLDEAIIASIGPERISPEWWLKSHQTRDYFRVQCESGRWLWLARGIERNRWFVHGVWA